MKIIRYLNPAGEIRFASVEADGKPYELLANNGKPVASDKVAEVELLLAPLELKTIYCVGLNYRAHAEETRSPIPEHPIIFMKSVSALQAPEQPIYLPRSMRSEKVDFEGELAVIIGENCRNVKKEDAWNYIAGYTIANDVSARDWQKEWGGGQWCRAKTFDTFCPMGPCMLTADEVEDPANFRIKTYLNDELMQDSSTGDMIFDVPTLVEFLSGSTTLLKGTAILTGTPAGVGMGRNPKVFLKAGDTISIEIDGIGRLNNPVKEERI
jgi:2-keto-4-pentenoate hydratase/2-oxohepta-3-ene-1,7-dioic acid hydratase in catechol pathway